MAHARGRTAFDLVQKAGPRTGIKYRIGAIAQQKNLLELVQRPVDRARAGKGAVIRTLLLFCAAMFLDLWKGMILCHQNIGKAFVIAQQDVEFRLQLLDQILFQQQRFGFGFCGQKHHRSRGTNHPVDPAAVATGARIV